MLFQVYKAQVKRENTPTQSQKAGVKYFTIYLALISRLEVIRSKIYNVLLITTQCTYIKNNPMHINSIYIFYYI